MSQPIPETPAPATEPENMPPVPTDTPRGYNRPIWPAVIGVLSMVHAGYAMLSCVMAAVYFIDAVLTGGVSLSWQEMFSQRQFSLVIYMGNAALAAAWGALLMVGGYLLTRRRTVAVTLLVVWAILEILIQAGVANLAIAGMSYSLSPESLRRMAISYGARSVRQIVYPVFLLIWFSRREIRRQRGTW